MLCVVHIHHPLLGYPCSGLNFSEERRIQIKMENGIISSDTSIMQLPDDCLRVIFHFLHYMSDRTSFGLTCRRWLHIQNACRRSLQVECSFTYLSPTSLSQTPMKVSPFHVSRLLNRFQHLESLSLSGCVDLPDSGLTALEYHASNLLSLRLDCCFGITDKGFCSIAEYCPCLTTISLYRVNIGDFGLKALSESCLALRDVNLSYCLLITDVSIKGLSVNCRQLRCIRISYCRNITGIGFQGCSETLSCLEADSCKLEPDGLDAIVSGGGLEYLDVSSLSWCILGDGLKAVGSGFGAKMRILNCRACRTMSDDSVKAIAKGCPVLEDWNLALCHEIREPGWQAIGTHCSKLKKLHVNRCPNFNDQCLKALQDGCKKLSVLYISRCRGVTELGLELFRCYRNDVVCVDEEIMCLAPFWAFS